MSVMQLCGSLRADPATSTPGPSPTPTATPAPVTGWAHAYYSYDATPPHAVSAIARGAGADAFAYDVIGGITDRDEGGKAWD